MSLNAEICLGGWSQGQASKFVLGLGPHTHAHTTTWVRPLSLTMSRWQWPKTNAKGHRRLLMWISKRTRNLLKEKSNNRNNNNINNKQQQQTICGYPSKQVGPYLPSCPNAIRINWEGGIHCDCDCFVLYAALCHHYRAWLELSSDSTLSVDKYQFTTPNTPKCAARIIAIELKWFLFSCCLTSSRAHLFQRFASQLLYSISFTNRFWDWCQ